MPNTFDIAERKDIMARALPWLVEKRTEDGTRILRRCAELHGGCGAVTEVPVAEGKRGSREFPGFTTWYRKHCRCGLTDKTFAKKRGPYGY